MSLSFRTGMRVVESPTGYVANFEVMEPWFGAEFDRLAGVPGEALNRHIIKRHLPDIGVMRSKAMRYDAELAAFHGLSLDETARYGVDVLEAVAADDFGSTALYKELTRRFEPSYFALDVFDPRGVLSYLEGLSQYTDRIASELVRLVELTVVSPGVVPEHILQHGRQVSLREPKDSFFRDYGVTLQ